MSDPLYVLEREQIIARPRHDVFAFFADPRNLETMTPGSLGFHILTPGPIVMRKGTIIDYDLRLFGVRFSWRTLIEDYEPERRFVDVQMKGPYKVWRHTHTFEDAPEGTLVRDRVEYALPLGPLGRVARALFVRRTLEGIFDFRATTMGRVFADA